jgi:histidyl-tRNA synthetase
MKYANRINASHAIIFGNDELQKGCAVVKNLDTGDQQEISLATLIPHMKALS